MRVPTLCLAVFLAVLATARGQDPSAGEALWIPEGYRLLRFEERKSLSDDELKAIGARNTQILRDAVGAMTPQERQDVAESLTRYGQAGDRPDYERQYLTMAQMLMLSRSMEEKMVVDRAAGERRFEDLLRAQEATGGFPSDKETVQNEARSIEDRIGKADARELYLKILRPLRARPWNEDARVVFRKIVRGDSYARAQKTSLYDAAIVFVGARRKESPSEGAWDSLEAFLRLSMRGEVAEARRLFASANSKSAKDTECRIFPILIAASEGDVAEVDRLTPRAREAWPAPGRLEEVLWQDIDMIPRESQARARQVLGERFKKARPADWDARTEIVAAALDRGEFRQVEQEAAALLALPPATLPEPHRTELRALALRAAAGLGRCEDVVAQIPTFEGAARAAYPTGRDFDDPPVPRTVADAQEVRKQIARSRRELERIRASVRDGSYLSDPRWGDVPDAERPAQAEAMLAMAAEEMHEMEALVADRDDAAVAAAWTRQDFDAWRERRRISDNTWYDEADRATRLGIQVRSAAGKCLLARGNAAAAALVLAPCVGSGANYHGDCGDPILEAGRALVKQGRLGEAASVYAATAPVQNFSSPSNDLYRAIEAAAPGTVRRFEPTVTPTPRQSPTPFAPPVP